MTPYSRPKLSDLYTLSQTKLVGNHTLHSGTYPLPALQDVAIQFKNYTVQKTNQYSLIVWNIKIIIH